MRVLGIARKVMLPVLAAALVLGASAGTATSYFTTYVTAQGGHALQLRDVQTTPHEEVDQNVKNIWVENTGEVECWVRAKAVAPTGVEISYGGEGWTLNEADGWYYYGTPVQPGQSTPVLTAAITMPKSEDELNPIPEGTELNVIVVTECTKVLYQDDGTPYANWDLSVKEG